MTGHRQSRHCDRRADCCATDSATRAPQRVEGGCKCVARRGCGHSRPCDNLPDAGGELELELQGAICAGQRRSRARKCPLGKSRPTRRRSDLSPGPASIAPLRSGMRISLIFDDNCDGWLSRAEFTSRTRSSPATTRKAPAGSRSTTSSNVANAREKPARSRKEISIALNERGSTAGRNAAPPTHVRKVRIAAAAAQSIRRAALAVAHLSLWPRAWNFWPSGLRAPRGAFLQQGLPLFMQRFGG